MIRWVTFSVVVLLLGLMLGCGIPQEKYDALMSELNTVKNELQSTKAELESNQSKVSELTSSLETSQNQLQSTKAELESNQLKVSELTSSLETSQNQLQSTKADLGSARSELNYTKGKLVDIEKVYPPREFSSSTELIEWLITNDISDRTPAMTAEGLYAQALELQEDALKDGYIISADVDPGERADEFYVACVAVINGELWAWGTDSDQPIEVSTPLGWAKVK